VGPRDAAWGPVGPGVGQWTCVSRPEATGRLYHSRQSSLSVGSYITKPLFAWTHSERKEDNEMNEDVFNGSIRKFLKTLG
jgi:uncharacterized protein DUF6494